MRGGREVRVVASAAGRFNLICKNWIWLLIKSCYELCTGVGVEVEFEATNTLCNVFYYRVFFRQVRSSSSNGGNKNQGYAGSCRQHKGAAKAINRTRREARETGRDGGNSTWRLLVATQVSINMHNSGAQSRVASAKLLRQFTHTHTKWGKGRTESKRN